MRYPSWRTTSSEWRFQVAQQLQRRHYSLNFLCVARTLTPLTARPMPNATSLRGLNNAIMHNIDYGANHSEHHLDSPAKKAAQEHGSTYGGDDSVPGDSTFRGAGVGHRRTILGMKSPHSDQIADHRASHPRDPLQRSRETNLSDTSILAQRGGHGRDSPIISRDLTTVNVGGGNVAGASRVVAPAERERSSGHRPGDEELPIELPGRYERMRILGRGSFGAVTLVKDSQDSKLYAMKTLNVGDRWSERVTAMAEVRLLRWLKHPSILSIFDTFLSADGRLVCLTTNYCDSGDLAKTVKHAAKTKSPLGEKTVLGWFAQLCMGVHHLHEEKRVLHRDIKPNNVFLMDSKRIIQLGDFGLAKVISDAEEQVKAEVGTPYYTSPEMCSNQPYGFPSDVWSLGIVLFELLALDVPFRSRDVVMLVSQVMKAPPPSLPDTYSAEVTALSRWMLQKDPLRRPTLTQVLACQPLRRHMTSFVKNYRPMNMAERQRRQDVKDLEAQMASIIEMGGDDPQIPAGVADGCGNVLVGGKDEAAGVEPKIQQTEARDGGTERPRISGEGAAPDEGEPRHGDATAPDGVIKALRLTEKAHEVASVATTTDIGGIIGVCNRCGAGGDNASVGGGNTTPVRRFGSPQQSKGARNIMSWATRGAAAVDDVREERGDKYRDPESLSSDGENCNIRRRSSDDNGSGGGGAKDRIIGDSIEESLRSHDGECRGGALEVDSGNEQCARSGSEGRKRSWEVGLMNSNGDNSNGAGDTEHENNARSVSLDDHKAVAHEATRPPRSPHFRNSARFIRVSGSSDNGVISSVLNETLSVGGKRCTRAISESNQRNDGKETARSQNPDDPGGASSTETTRLAPPTSSAPDAIQAADVPEGTNVGRDAGAYSELEAPVTIARLETIARKEDDLPTATVSEWGSTLSVGRAKQSSTAAIVEGVARASEEVCEPRDRRNSPLRSPRISGSVSETFKTAKRLSEALTFAAGNLGR